MADVKISELGNAATLDGNELVPLVQSGVTLKTTTQDIANLSNGGTGTVTSVSVVPAHGISGTVANQSTTPAITLTLGAITPASVAATGVISASNISGFTSGVNTGDQTNVPGSASSFTGALSGDVGGTQSATAIANEAVTNAKLAQMAANTLKGNNTGGFAAPADLTTTQATAMLDNFNATTKGLVPLSGGGTSNFLRADGSWALPVSVAANRAIASDGSGVPVASATTAAELGFVSGVSSAIQTQLNTKQAAGNYITALTGDVSASGPGSTAATVNSVGGSSATNVHSAELAANAATNLNTASTIVKRDASGNFSAGQITANLTGNASGSAASFTGSLVGDVTGTQGATALAAVGTAGTYTQVTTDSKGRVTAGSNALVVSTISGNTTAVLGTTYFCNTSGGAFNLTLPAPLAGGFVRVKDTKGSFFANNLTIVRNASEKIENVAASYVVTTDYGSITLVSDGTDWFIV